jgi:WD40 repeat protein/tRNA A-37 threonylcarbamoyl transferase component Bud32
MSAAEGSPDRNLLFGILALQMDFISRDALIAAMNAWVLDKSKPLGLILKQQGALPDEEHNLLEGLVQKHLQKHANDPAQSLAAVSSVGSFCQRLQELADPDVQASLAQLATSSQAALDPYPTRASSTVGTPTSLGERFRILRPHARGGLGAVYVALDQELHREVALKEIQPQHADHPESRARFLLEAEVTGRLEHPSIVPVYGLGTYADGRPFYAMRFIKGDSLQEAIKRFHQADTPGRNLGSRHLELRQLLGRFLDVCNAVAYAHSRGVLHRDLKPGNVMLGPYGETMVVDWGLAKVLGYKEHNGTAGETTLRTKVSSGSVETVDGSAVGTPAYMSPEQAEGRLDELGAASDVYSLGATLYCLLTGQAPFAGAHVADILSNVRRGDFLRPRQVRAAVPPALEAICLKAMAQRPAERYVSPRHLADDIEHWLADEPVSAYRERLPARLGRGVRQHKILVGSAAAIGAVAATALIAVLLVSAAEARQRQEQGLREEAEVQRERAQQQQQLAEQEENLAEQNRIEADKQRGPADRYLYSSHMDLAHREWQAAHVGRVLELLEEHRTPKAGQEDLRGFEWHYLWRVCHSERIALPGLTEPVSSVAFSPDGKWLAAGSTDCTLRLWDTATAREIRTFKGHASTVWSVAFSPDGKQLASASHDETVRLWDSATGQEILTLKGHRGRVSSVAFSPDGSRLASSGWDGTVRLWDPLSGKELQCFKGDTYGVYSVAFSPDGNRLAAGCDSGMVKLLKLGSSFDAETLSGHQLAVRSVAFSRDGKRLASGSSDHTVKLWDTTTGQEVLTLKAQSGQVLSVAFSFDGNQVVTGGEDGTVRLWDLATGQEGRILKGHTGPVSSVVFCPGSRRLASGGDHTVNLWRPTACPDTLAFDTNSGWVSCIAFSPDGKQLASAGPGYRPVRIWDAATGQLLLSLKGHAGSVRRVAYSPDGKRLASASEDKSVKLWDSATGQELLTLKGNISTVLCVAFSPDGNQLAAGSDDGTVKLWDPATGREGPAVQRQSGPVWSVAFSPDGKRLASAGSGSTLKLWDTATGQELLSLKGHRGEVVSVTFHPDGRRLASGSEDQTIKLWDVSLGQNSATLYGHHGTVYSLAFSPDGKRLASGSGDRKVMLWDTATGQEVLTLEGLRSPVMSVRFNPDGKQLAACYFEGVNVWDAAPLTPGVLLHREAAVRVPALFLSLARRADVIDSLRHDTSLSEQERQACLSYAQRYEANPAGLNSVSWKVVGRSDAAVEAYRQALRQAEEACRLAPESRACLNTLGVAQYRVGQYQSALATLTRSDKINAAGSQGSEPSDLAFLAMAHHKLGQHDKAQVCLQRLRQAMKQDRWAGDAEAWGFLREAESLLNGTKP